MTTPTPAAFPAQMDLSALPDDALVPFGWAPGDYTFRCRDCSHEVNKKRMADVIVTAAKRTSRCREHALEAALRAEKAKSEGLEAEIENLKHDVTAALEAASSEATALSSALERIHELEELLGEAGAQFRFYEQQHRAKQTDEATAKAEVNAALAARIEAALSSALARIAELEGALEKIDGEAPAMNEPPKCWTCSDPCEAFHEGYVRGLWDAAVIARAALQPAEEIAK